MKRAPTETATLKKHGLLGSSKELALTSSKVLAGVFIKNAADSRGLMSEMLHESSSVSSNSTCAWAGSSMRVSSYTGINMESRCIC